MEYLLPLLCVAAFLIINTKEKIKTALNALLLNDKVKTRVFTNEIKKETIDYSQLKDFVNIIATDTSRYKRNDAVKTNGKEFSDVRFEEQQLH
jgi:hypothetical protein